MRKTVATYYAVLVVLSVGWFLADRTWLGPYSFFSVRSAFVQYSGVLGMGVMSLSMVLAMRSMRLQHWLNGLDKMYRLHKWLGITGLVLSVLHWLWAKGPKWATAWGWMERRAHRPGRSMPDDMVLRWLVEQRHFAEQVGEWAFYALVVLLLIALIKAFSYRTFFKTHRLLPLVYLLLVFHSLVLTNISYWRTPLGWVLAILMGAGTVAALISLFGKVGALHRSAAVVESLESGSDSSALKMTVRLAQQWPGHEPGQFAFLRIQDDRDACPFTLISVWQADQRLSFLIQVSGGWTQKLRANLKVGDSVKVEGPYGCFNFKGDTSRQIWVAVGMGVTPFVARLKSLQTAPGEQPIDFFYCSAILEKAAQLRLEADARAAGVRLHILVDGRDGPMDALRMIEAVPMWREATCWFCGPEQFGKILLRQMVKAGFSAERFHQEFFNFR